MRIYAFIKKGLKMKNTALKNKSCRAVMFLCFCVFMLLLTPALLSAIELPRTAKLVPPETIVLADINNFNQLWAQFEKTNIYQLYKDPAMKAFIDNFKTRWQEKKQESKREYLKIITDAGVLPQGRLAAALVYDQQVQDVNELPVLVVAQWGDKIDKVKETANEIVRKAVEDGARRQTEDYRGVEILTVETNPPKALSYCFVDDCLIGSTSPNVLKFVIAQIKGAGSPTLVDDRDYVATGNAIDPTITGRIDLYVNIKQAVRIELAEDTTGKAKAFIENLGLSNVTSFGCSIEPAGGPGGSTYGKAILKIDGAKEGIFKMLDLESGPIRLPRFIDASACSISVVNLNIKKAFDELTNILTRFSPQMASIMYMPILPPGPNGEPGLQLKADIIDHLGSQIILAQSIDKPQPERTARPAEKQPPLITRSVVAIAIENRASLEKSLSMIHSKMIAPNNPDARRELLGHTIYTVNLSGLLPMLGGSPGRNPMQAPPAGPGMPKIPPSAFTLTDTHLIFASEFSVEQAIRTMSSNAETINSQRWFNKAKSSIPSAIGVAGLQDNAASGEVLWSTLRQSKKPDKAGGDDKKNQISVGITSQSIFPQIMYSRSDGLIDFSLLPEFDAVKKYFGLTAFYGISCQDGFFFELKYLNPE
jgi:hypothetical protein